MSGSVTAKSFEYAEHPDDDGEDALPMTDEELRAADTAAEDPWVPDVADYYDMVENDADPLQEISGNHSILPSKFTQFAFRMPTAGGWENFSFEGRRHLHQIYDTPVKRVLLMCGRQVEKSTLLGNRALSFCCLIPSYKVLYVSPSMTQTKTFSNDRVKDPIDTSPVLRAFTSTMLSQNILEKQFVNRSKITMRYAYLNADRTRGVPAHKLLIDEMQDIISDNIPVIEQCLSHSPEELKRYVYSGTPKSLDNVIEDYWSNRSTQNQWAVPCDCKTGDGGRYWNILGEKNIGLKHLICERCGKRIYSMHQDAQWAAATAWDPRHAPFEGFRIPQLMVPWLDWSGLLYNFNHYPRNQFYNEVLGVSFDSGFRPLTKAEVMANCRNEIMMSDAGKYMNQSNDREIFAGIDWGTGENSYTVLTLGCYVGNKFRIFYWHRFIGEDTEPERMLGKIEDICRSFNCRIIGTDYGGGHYPNDTLVRKFGKERVMKYQYAGRLNTKVKWEPKLNRWLVHRTEVMSALFNALKRGNVFEFPRWVEMKDPYASDMTNIYSEYNAKLRMIQYGHTSGKTDDSFHSMLYCFLASMIRRPRPDIISPNKETKGQGIVSSYSGTVDQG
jgi:hypothetical protein